MLYSVCDSGNYYVIPGSPFEAWEADHFTVTDKDNLRVKMDYGPDDFVIVVVGSQFLYRDLWLEHAFVLKALLPLIEDLSSNHPNSLLKIILLSGGLTSNYSVAVEVNAYIFRSSVQYILDSNYYTFLLVHCLLISIFSHIGHCSKPKIPQEHCEIFCWY